jgi:serine/threonine-protein kinase
MGVSTPNDSSDAFLHRLRTEANGLSGAELLTLVRADQRQRWQRGERFLVENYLERLPQLAVNSEWILDLVYNEVLLREERGEQPDAEEYLGRFPLHQSRLRRQFIVHRALDWGSLLAKSPAQEIDPNGRTLTGAELTPPPSFSRPTVPGYTILEELGRGGMGVVYKAWQETLKRPVALKMILIGEHASEEHLARFRAEAEAVAKLQHPGIVQIYEIGEYQNRPYFALEFISGGNLESLLGGKPMHCREAAPLLEAVARAVHYAHQCGVIHRDLKPANVLLQGLGIRNSGSGNGTDSRLPNLPSPLTNSQSAVPDPQSPIPNSQSLIPKITDFGLAKRLDADSGQTQCGDVIGTPSYMAPEQAAGQNDAVGPTTDVYALGAILFEMLTGRPPFCGDSAQATVSQVAEQVPVPPSLLNPRVDRDLEIICLKCLEKAPTDRYASAEEMANDLGRYRRGEPIVARAMNLFDRVVRALERSQDDLEFQQWGPMLLCFGVILFVAQTSVAALLAFRPDTRFLGETGFLILAVRALQLGLMVLAFWHYRKSALLPRSAAERQLWSIWLGYLAATVIIVLCNFELQRTGRVASELTLYPVWSVLSGLAFFVMGSSYWGRLYVIGLAFFLMAVLMPFQLEWAPLEFGILWCASLVGIGLHLRHLQQRDAPATTPKPQQPISMLSNMEPKPETSH